MHKLLNLLFELWGWIRIVASPVLLSLIVAGIAYYFLPNVLGLIIGIVCVCTGLIFGCVWATKVYKSKQGTIQYLSTTNSWPELDEEKK